MTDQEQRLRECVHWADDPVSLAHIGDHMGMVKQPWPDDLTVDGVLAYFRKLSPAEQRRVVEELEDCPW